MLLEWFVCLFLSSSTSLQSLVLLRRCKYPTIYHKTIWRNKIHLEADSIPKHYHTKECFWWHDKNT